MYICQDMNVLGWIRKACHVSCKRGLVLSLMQQLAAKIGPKSLIRLTNHIISFFYNLLWTLLSFFYTKVSSLWAGLMLVIFLQVCDFHQVLSFCDIYINIQHNKKVKYFAKTWHESLFLVRFNIHYDVLKIWEHQFLRI